MRSNSTCRLMNRLSEEEIRNRLKQFSSNIGYIILDEQLSINDLDKRLNSLYETLYSDIAYMNICDDSISEGSCCKLIVYERGALKHILLFKYNEKVRHIRVLNYYFRTSLQDVEYLRNIIFDEYRRINKIVFPCVLLENVEKRPMMVLYEQNKDKIIELPESMDVYMKSLGPNTRRRVKDGRKFIVRDHPDFKTSFYVGKDISRKQVSDIMELNKSRMQYKGKTCGYDDTDRDIFFRYAHIINGILCLCTINENIVGGSISWAFKEHVYVDVLAHNNAYNKYRAGYVTLAHTIQYMIEKNLKYLHFMWGEEEFKYHFLGKPHIMYDVMVFRTYPDFLLNRILFGIRSLMKTTRERLGKNATLKKLYRKIRNL